MSSNEAPKRATAAQLANRKIKAARERRTRVGSPSVGLPQPSANPFSSVGTDTAAAAPTFSAPSGGFTFGQSQGFSRPATATGTSNNAPSASSSFESNQGNTPGAFKLFGNQTASAPPSFDFSSNNSQQVSNPFSNMNSNQNTGFQGFKGSMFNIPGSSQPENKKPENQPNGSGGFFGQASTQTSAPLFGATPTTSAPLFSSSAGPNMFGQTNNNNPPTNIFGSAPMTSPTKSTGGSEAMQMSPDGPKSTGGPGIFNVSAPAPRIYQTNLFHPFGWIHRKAGRIHRGNLRPAQSDTDATNDPSDETEKHSQADFTRSGPGEENEDAVFECRSRAYQLTEGKWEVKGVGVLRILKHRTNKKSRIILRADPSGSVVLNTNLMPEIDYKQNSNNVQFFVASESGFQQWMLRVKTKESAGELRDSMEQHKKRD
ncbi:hypothetical protein MGYG_00346 [Nannizzia gypsea CBS 118893]|uniref:RanBD1 domain-containing protein n=1 Tax=Arthroderma gypseum (strain ATCC MYA-4604 / CBS 118893) TaxID=535722 RepID=E5QZ73_ARTGP|nr:hypothetical protein MGYG_00346 [Nannizzia gypsea CBS 118893]EFQ97305.1 hypothetical protein MGYG_00346 [Nannizzia gypsea CBS 118893]